MRLKDKVTIVTGAAQGIGKAYTLRLAQEGAKVLIADFLDGSGFAREIDSKGGETLALQIDVSDERSTQEMAEKTIDRFGRIDILINNAAYFLLPHSSLILSNRRKDKNFSPRVIKRMC